MIYVVSPIHRTGGVELLHQLAYELNKYLPTKMCYIQNRPLIEEYRQYQVDYVFSLPDDEDYVVVPEIFARMELKNHKRIIYWESVDNYLARSNDLIFDPDIIHLAQSEYAWDFLKNGINAEKVIRVTDYINDAFLEPHEETERRRVVLYNPAKGLQYTKRIIAACPDIRFISLTGLTREEMVQAMRTAMLYIDFGDHPGKDRMPREAAACGCCVLTGRNGSARYYKDVPIPNIFKLERTDTQLIAGAIYDILDNYAERRREFDWYRHLIHREKAQFQEGVKELVETQIQHHNPGT